MKFEVLGPLRVRHEATVMAPARGHRCTILALLLAQRGHAVSTGALIRALWSASPPRTARKSLQSHVSRLRSELAAVTGDGGDVEVIETTADGYRIDLETHTLDAVRFESLVARARDLLEGSDPASAAECLGAALELWRGRAYGELATHDGIRAEAQRLQELRHTARVQRCEAWLALGFHGQAIAAARRAIAAAPTDERQHALLMRALYADEQQSEALAVYDQLRERLRDELGVDPSPRLQRLHQQVLQHDPELAVHPRATGQVRPSRGGRTGPRPTVPTLPRLVGRDDHVEAIAELLRPKRLVTLTGPGGVGKTRLAEHAAARAAGRFTDGTAMATLATVRDPDGVGDALVTTLGIQPTGDDSVEDTIVAALEGRNLLLVLDNCEHVLDAIVPLAASLLRHCGELALLATSRERLRLTGEQLWPVAPLEVPGAGAVRDEVLATPAGALFELRARQADATFALTEEVAADVAELCRRLDGMPLALELAAARMRALEPAELVGRLDQRFSLLAGGPRHEAGRHRTLQAVVAWSYDLLQPREATLFDRLSVFSGAPDLAAVEEVCAGDGLAAAEVPTLLGELVDKSMVVAIRDVTGLRYRLLDTMREYGSRRLADHGAPERWRRSHAEYHVGLAVALGPQVCGPDEATAVSFLGAAFDDIRAAHAWLLAEGDLDGSLRIPAALDQYLFYRLRDEVTTWARRSVALPGAGSHPSFPGALATAAIGATSRTRTGRAQAEAGQVLEHKLADPRDRVSALTALGTAALYEGQLDELLVRADEVATIATSLDEDFHRAFAGVLRVLAHEYRGDRHAALAALPGLDEAALTSGSPTMRAFARYCRGEVLLDAQPDEAVTALEEAVALAASVDNELVAGVSMVSLASLRGRLGHVDGALRTFRDVVRHWRRLGDHTHQLTTLRNLVVLLADIDPTEQVATLHGAATAGETPSFGPERDRLLAAWSTLESALGSDAAEAAARAGRRLRPGAAGGRAIQYIERLLDR